MSIWLSKFSLFYWKGVKFDTLKLWHHWNSTLHFAVLEFIAMQCAKEFCSIGYLIPFSTEKPMNICYNDLLLWIKEKERNPANIMVRRSLTMLSPQQMWELLKQKYKNGTVFRLPVLFKQEFCLEMSPARLWMILWGCESFCKAAVILYENI